MALGWPGATETNREAVEASPADRLPMTGDSRKFLSFTLLIVTMTAEERTNSGERERK